MQRESGENGAARFAPFAGIRNGVFTSWTVDQYVVNFRGTPAPDEATRTRRGQERHRGHGQGDAEARRDHVKDYLVLLEPVGSG